MACVFLFVEYYNSDLTHVTDVHGLHPLSTDAKRGHTANNRGTASQEMPGDIYMKMQLLDSKRLHPNQNYDFF